MTNYSKSEVLLCPYVWYSRHMDKGRTLAALAALSQGTRLDVFRLLAKHEPDGLAAGEVARELAVPHNTMSAHLAILARAGLVVGSRHARSIVYRADLNRLREMTLYLVKDCCGGRPELCEPLIADLLPCCPAEPILVADKPRCG